MKTGKIMKKYFVVAVAAGLLLTGALFAQGKITVPQVVKSAFAKKFPGAKYVTWESEKGNYEANWGGKSGEDNSVLYSPSGQFVEIAKAISVRQLPASAISYVKIHYKGFPINEAALVTDANGKVTYETEVNHKDVIFDQNGKFINPRKKIRKE